ncbi:hypothetical protein N7462_004274 [Penicillium macrosclerotiorum]|uniref:uncharacterized protein n=1 Tax=Penicillium macrosclerotiorum TaxID=303699 RepID=UPI002548E36B|nr:uncharacterized protein N7462_004274 [Penicillium macrosclerotiorum]KAJ5689882.1 hypothetical protein N7462_004274 [Penicillium macrosclerotiorum]
MISGPRPATARLSGRRLVSAFTVQRCGLHYDGRSRVSNFWIPTGGISKKAVVGEKGARIMARREFPLTIANKALEDANDLLIRGGFLRQVSLSSISSQELWEQSGRLTEGSEVFRFNDRRDARFLLAPTHEEEITTLVGGLTTSYKSLPLRPRPRQGLFRGREFIMKDLYTFDYSVNEALKTYSAVKHAYTQLFDELKIPYLVAAADSGNMGGTLSHEFHFISNKGEDRVVSCSNCDHVYNEELADGKTHSFAETSDQGSVPGFQTDDAHVGGGSTVSNGMWMAISHDGSTLLRGWYPKFSMQNGSSEPAERHINSHAVKAVATAAGVDLDLSVENPLEKWASHVKARDSSEKPRVLDLYDSEVRVYQRPPLSDLLQEVGCTAADIEYSMLDRFPGTSNKLSLVRVHDGDHCSHCAKGLLTSHLAVELGHTFHLGTRYSEPLNAMVSVNSAVLDGTAESGNKSAKEQIVPMQMGCHGIGVSRMIAAVVNRLADSKGLNWPRAIAPFEVVIVPGKGLDSVAEQVYDGLTSGASGPIDTLLDDRDKGMGWKLGDADLIGYPVIVVVGNGWKKNQTLEVQCRRLGVKEDVALGSLPAFIEGLLSQL